MAESLLLELLFSRVRAPNSSQVRTRKLRQIREMRCRAFCFFFIILNVEFVHPLVKRNDSCVEFRWNHTFEFSFFSKENHSLESCVNNSIHHCLQNHSAVGTKSCESPAISVNFPSISRNPRMMLNKLHRPVLATKESSTNTTSQILCAFEQIWQLFILCLMAAILSGILIWFFDHKANSGHFPNSFWSGIWEGLWWAIVTMTTVGYGDKTPRSFLGRAYASLWMIIGMLLISAFTAQISSVITADGLSPLNEIFGNKIGVPLGSKDFFRKYCYGAESVTEYSTENELLTSLQNDTVDKVWLFECPAKEINPDLDFTIVSVLYDELTWQEAAVGVRVQFLNTGHFDKHFTECLKKENCTMKTKSEPHTESLSASSARSEQIRGTETAPDYDDYSFWEVDSHCLKGYSRGKYRQGIKRASSTRRLGLIDCVLLACGALIVILLTVGALWNRSVRVRHMENIAGNTNDVEKGAWNIELEVKTNELQTKESATASG